MARRGPQGEPMALVKLKNQPGQMSRALKSGRLQAHDLAERAVSDLAVLDRETPEIWKREVTPVEFRKMIVDSVAGLKILRQPDEILLQILVQLLVDIQRLHINGVEPTQTNDDGDTISNPEFDAYLKLVDRATKILSQLGLNPSTRAQIIANTAAATKDAVEVTSKSSPFMREVQGG